MVQTCSAYGCKNRYHKDKEISFHKPGSRAGGGAASSRMRVMRKTLKKLRMRPVEIKMQTEGKTAARKRQQKMMKEGERRRRRRKKKKKKRGRRKRRNSGEQKSLEKKLLTVRKTLLVYTDLFYFFLSCGT